MRRTFTAPQTGPVALGLDLGPGDIRIFTDDRGQSRFEELAVGLSPGFAVPPAQPLHNAPFLAAEGTFWVGAPTDWQGDAPHPAPRRMVFVTARGEYEVTASGGATKRFRPAACCCLGLDVNVCALIPPTSRMTAPVMKKSVRADMPAAAAMPPSPAPTSPPMLYPA